MRSRRGVVAAASVATALLLTACSGHADGGDTAAGAPPADEPAAAPTGPSGTDAGATDAEGSASPEGSRATIPAFSAATLTGGQLDSTELAGRDTVLWFWAPWCTVCRAESDDVVAAAAALDGEVEVVGVAGRGDVGDMEGFVADTGTDGLTHVVDEDGTIWTTYGVATQPTFAFIDDSGEVEVVVGPIGEAGLVERMTALAEA